MTQTAERLTLRDAVATDVVTTARAAVADLVDALPDLLASSTDPQALDLAELFHTLQELRNQLQGAERDAEGELGRALVDDMVQAGGWRIERHRSRSRTSWAHDEWRRDVRRQLLRTHGLLGAQLVTGDGELVEAGKVLQELLTAAQDVAGKQPPKVTSLRSLGLDPMDYSETAPGAVHVRVQRVCEEGDE